MKFLGKIGVHMKTYVVVKNGLVLSAGENRETQLAIAKAESGIESKTPLADIELWECTPDKDATMIWRCTWESAGPLEPNVICGTPSLVPDGAVA